jgi:multidrug efflux pump subunit AcrB
VLAVVFLAMFLVGTDLQRISLGALIIALGLLVDDAIIAVEMMVVKLAAGWPKPRAAAFAWTSTAFPMLTGTLVTAAGFLPIGLAHSTVGEYAGDIFRVVGIALVASWLVAVVFTPYLGVRLLREPRTEARTESAIYDTPPYRVLRRIVAGCVRHPLPVVVATALVFALGVAAFLRVPQQFFPRSERTELFLELRLPAGTSIGVTDAVTARAEHLLAGDADITGYTSYVGQGAPRFWLGLFPQQPDPAFGEIVIVARDLAARERVKARLEHALAEGALPEARVRLDRFNFGPPVGYPVQFRVIGQDPLQLRRIAYRVRDIMRANPDALDPNLDWDERMPSLRLQVDQDRARAVGLTPADIAEALQTLLNGFTVTTMLEGTERIDIVARAIPQERRNLADLADLTIAVRDGVAIPLGQAARIVDRAEDAILWRRNREPVITVRADVPDGVQAPDVSNAIWPALATLRAALPAGTRIEMGGAIEEAAKANTSIYVLLPLMLLVTAGLLMAQLQSFSRMFLVLLTAPLGVIGAALALHLSQRPFGFVALLGMIALGGMIMRNSVILVDQIETDVAIHGSVRQDAIVAATVRRARPVVLTALAAILAMIPLSQSAFWGPMASVIMGGLFVATLLTILFLPALYALWFCRRLSAGMADTPSEDDGVKLPAEAMDDG